MAKSSYIAEAKRYLTDAKKNLSKIPLQFGSYTDPKLVSEAAGIAYLAALKAIDGYLVTKRNLSEDQLPDSIAGYREAIRNHVPLDGKLSTALHLAYQNLHILAYYRGGTGKKMLDEGIENVQRIIRMLDV